VRRSAESASEISQAFAELVKEQARSNVEAFQALTRAVDWDQVSAPKIAPWRFRRLLAAA
jgi:hypothetical protein